MDAAADLLLGDGGEEAKTFFNSRSGERYTAFLKKWALADAVGPGLVFRLTNGVN
jgi:hypothetical protein